MIDKIYIDNAKIIRSEFLKLNKELDKYQDELKKLVSYLEKVSVELQEFSNTEVKSIRTKGDATNVVESLLKKMTEIEDEEQKLIRLVQPINDKIEKLRVEENYLFQKLKEKYTSMSEDEIRKEIQSSLEK